MKPRPPAQTVLVIAWERAGFAGKTAATLKEATLQKSKRSFSMPLIDIHVLEGVFTDEEKAQMIAETAKGFGKVAGKTMEEMTSVRVHEVKSGHWGGSQSVWTTKRALEAKAKG